VKDLILAELIGKLKNEMLQLESAAKANKDFATDQEFKAESKYDTRSLEASYLASAEAKRVEDLKLEIQMLEDIDLKYAEKSEEICIGSLINLRYSGQDRAYFLIPTSGGTLLQISGQSILVVSVFSPLGDAVLGLRTGDRFDVETPKETRSYEVTRFQ
jgi:transcription elongation GreA/GreB family factor